jgi:hypothetical protein
MKRSASVRLTIVAAVGMAASAQSRLDPCGVASFNDAACHAAIQSGGYCWNGHWVKLNYHYPYPYYYDLNQKFLSSGGTVTPAVVETCGPVANAAQASHAPVIRAGFGTSGATHSAGG